MIFKKTSTYKHAKTELELLSKSKPDKDNRPLIEPFKKEILALCEKFGKSGQSGSSAPYVARALSQSIEKLLLSESLLPIMGTDDEWEEIAMLDGGIPLYQNNRESGIFKEGKDGRAHYIYAITKVTQDGTRWHGTSWLSKDDYLNNRVNNRIDKSHYIKSFPFVPKTFDIDVIEEEVNPDDWEMWLVDPKQLEEVFEYYDKMEIND